MNENKVILISVDGMRPDGFLACKNPYIGKMMQMEMFIISGLNLFLLSKLQTLNLFPGKSIVNTWKRVTC